MPGALAPPRKRQAVMPDDTAREGTIAVLSCEVSPTEVDAAADITLRVTVSCTPAADLRGETLRIEAGDGASVATLELAELDGETGRASGECRLKAPIVPGEHNWRAVWPADTDADAADDAGERASGEFTLTVKAHALHIVVWDVPPAIESGREFSVKVGVKCSSGCRPDGWAFELRDHEGIGLATASPGGESWPGTADLHYAEVALRAPDEAALYEWEAAASAVDAKRPHEPGAAPFGVRVVPKPDCLVTVLATDRESGNPVEGVRVVVHPYRTVTDAGGVAKLTVPKGEYRLFVSGQGYLPFRDDREVTKDVTIPAELDLDVPLSDADLWS